MKDSVKLGAAVVGGYLLGRTKKGKTAIGLALWLGGKRMGGSREVLTRLATAPEVAKLTAQLRGPLLVAAQRAANATLESRTTALADSLQRRTSQLLATSGTVVDQPADEDAEWEDAAASRTRSPKARKAKRRGTPEEPETRREWVELLDTVVDDGDPTDAVDDDEREEDEGTDERGEDEGTAEAEEVEEPEPPRQAKRKAKPARPGPAGGSADDNREPKRGREPAARREPARSREPGRRRSARRDGETA